MKTDRARRFQDPGAFRNAVSGFLADREAENCLPIGILSQLAAGEYADHRPLFVAVFAGDAVVAAALRTPPYPWVVSRCEDPTAVATILAPRLLEVDPHLPGFLAPEGVGGAMVRELARLTGRPLALERRQLLYELTDLLAPSRSAAGSLRPVVAEDRSWIPDWFRAFARDVREPSFGGSASVTVDRYLAAEPRSRGLRVWEVGGEPVSLAGYGGPTPTGIRVGPVYTPEAHRGRGYATACVGALTAELLGWRERCFLFTDADEPAPNHVYRKIGYVPIARGGRYLFET